MNKFFGLLAIMFFSVNIYSQVSPSVTINTIGNRNRQIKVDDKTYPINNTSGTDAQSVVINDLPVGQHSLEVLRRNQN